MYVFGLDLPIMELLFIMFVIMTIFLIIIFLEIKKLTRDIKIEDRDIGLLDKQVQTNNLEKYIKTALSNHEKPDQIRKNLIQRGWDKSTIDKLMKK